MSKPGCNYIQYIGKVGLKMGISGYFSGSFRNISITRTFLTLSNYIMHLRTTLNIFEWSISSIIELLQCFFSDTRVSPPVGLDCQVGPGNTLRF